MIQTPVYLGLGSNIEPARNLSKAVAALKQLFGALSLSPVYESAAVGFKGDNFLNCVVGVHTDLSLVELIQTIKQLEDQLGRRRDGARFSSRLIDIDILIYGATCCVDPIVLPREEILENAYVLRPFAELAPDLLLPGTERTLSELWQAYDAHQQPLKPVTLELG